MNTISNTANALEIRGLRKDFGDFSLQDVDLTVPAGSVVGLIGENGAGKTTTIKTAMELLHRDCGSVKFYGKELAEDPNGIREKISVVFDTPHFSPNLNMKQAEAICSSIYRSWDSQTWEDCMRKFNLPQKKPLKDFSKGMKMKFNLAVGLSHHASLLILDEPTSGLDPVMRDDILDIFLDFMQDESHAILLSSHITTDLEKIADYIAFLHEGKLIFCLPKDQLLYQYGVIRCSRSDFAKIRPEDMVAWRMEDYQCSVLTSDRQGAGRRYPELVIDAPTIEEIMLFYVKGERK